jgi:hypothetical protein
MIFPMQQTKTGGFRLLHSEHKHQRFLIPSSGFIGKTEEEIMLEKTFRRSFRFRAASAAGLCIVITALGGIAIAAQDKYTVRVPNGLALSSIRGYENWQPVSVSHALIGTENEALRLMVANPIMIDAYRSGVPGNGKPFPNGSKLVKIVWSSKKSTDAPFDVSVPNSLFEVEFMEKDSKRFADSGGWGYADFSHDPATGAFAPKGNDAKCGAACHQIAKSKDYVFTEYGAR